MPVKLSLKEVGESSKKIEGHQVQAVLKAQTEKGIKEKHMVIGDPVKMEAPVASVSISMTQTINTGNYSSAKVGVILTMPCQTKEIDVVFDFAKKWAEEKMSLMVEEIINVKEEEPDNEPF